VLYGVVACGSVLQCVAVKGRISCDAVISIVRSAVSCSVLQCVVVCCSVAVCCSVLQCIAVMSPNSCEAIFSFVCSAVCYSALHCVAVCDIFKAHEKRRSGRVEVWCNVLQCAEKREVKEETSGHHGCSVLQRAAVCCSVLQCASVCYSELQCVAVCCSVW